MCVVRKPRTSYTLEEDVAMMQEVMAPDSGVFGGGSAASKLEAWMHVAERVSAKGVDVMGDGLRRHVTDLVKKFKRQGPEPAGGRMRWGMPWPKSDDEVERDRLIEEYMKRLEEVKKAGASVSRPIARAAASKKTLSARSATLEQPHVVTSGPVGNAASDTAGSAPSPKNPPHNHQAPFVPANKPAQVYPARSARPQATVVCATTKPPIVKRKQPESVATDDNGIDLDEMWSLDLPPSDAATPNERMKLELKRRRLEMEERTQNRMLDIQAEQITLQREQLRLQAEAMRSMAESTQAIARALHALQKHLP